MDEVFKQMVEDYNSGMTIAQVSKKYNKAFSSVQRLFKKHGVKTRNASEAQKNALATGRAFNPTKGKGHTEESKILMSEKSANRWARITEAEREVVRQKARDKWSRLTESQKQEMLRLAGISLRKVSKEGSEIEQYVEKALMDAGYSVQKHVKNFMNGDYEIDLLVTDQNVAVELDGPHHYEPIFGEDRLAKTMMFDMAKNGALIGMGLTVMRVKCTFKNLTAKIKRDVSQLIIDTLKKIEAGEITSKLVEVQLDV